jgi:predicted heme/steroid binding protein
MDEIIRITSDELKLCDGQNGRPAFIAYKGRVYDVTDCELWSEGEHFDVHIAGQDISDEMSNAPHGE